MREEENDLQVLEIAVYDFDLNLLPVDARSPGSERFKTAVERYYADQLHGVAATHTVSINADTIRVTWRKSPAQDTVEHAVAALQKGDYRSGVQILEMLLPSREQDADVHFNLGMAYSDLGKLDKAVDHLQRAVALDRTHVNAKVALGVAFSRRKEYERAASVLHDAVLNDPDNGYALRNLGAVLMQLGRNKDDAIRYLSRAVEALPNDQQAWCGLGQARMDSGDFDNADVAFRRVIDLQPHTPMAEMAKEMRSRIAQQNFRRRKEGGVRPDAVIYCVAALRKFAEMSPEQVRNVGVEIATVGMNGINVNDPKSKYHLRTLPGVFTGLQLLCYEYVAFKQFAPELDIGFDLHREYGEAKTMMSAGL